MKKNYSKAVLTLGAIALMAGSANAEGTWRNINSKLVNPGFIKGWSGALTQTDFGVAETYNGAFEIYQVISDLPAGEYTLKANAFYRPGQKHQGTEAAYIFLNGNTKKVMLNGGEVWSMEQANDSFAAGNYVNTLTVNHPGGDLKLGIRSLGTSQDEWCCFDNFTLTGPNGNVAIVNGDFSEGFDAKWASESEYKFNDCGWECTNVDGLGKQPDVNRAGGIYRKTNASPYNFGQQVELPAGKYRWGVQSFLRHGGAGNLAGQYITCKGDWELIDGESALDRHNNATELEADNAYIYVTSGWDTDENDNLIKPMSKEYALDPDFGNPNGFWNQKSVMCMFDVDLDVYPDNEPTTAAEEGNEDGYGWCDSGFEYQAAKLFINNPEMYRNYIEFELAAPTKVWLGLMKDKNAPTQYWNPFRDFTLEVWGEGAYVDGIDSEAVAAPVYYNLQGVRVANPERGIFIVREGNKTSKRVF